MKDLNIFPFSKITQYFHPSVCRITAQVFRLSDHFSIKDMAVEFQMKT